MDHITFMRKALLQAQCAFRAGEVPIGAVVVSPGGQVISRAHNKIERLHTQAAHAEVRAIEKAGKKIAVVNLLGRDFMQPVDCPFKAVQTIIEQLQQQTKVILVDIHAEATSEKLAMGYFLTQKVSAVVGTHTHIPTADERIIDNHTAYITDVGMTGSFDSVLGRQKDQIIERFITNMPVRFNLAQNDVRIQGVIIEIDETSGAAVSISRVEYK